MLNELIEMIVGWALKNARRRVSRIRTAVHVAERDIAAMRDQDWGN